MTACLANIKPEPMIDEEDMNPVTVTPEAIAQRILFIRGHKFMLDAELAELYGGNDQGTQSGCETQHPALSR